jgi:hypothetical protein
LGHLLRHTSRALDGIALFTDAQKTYGLSRVYYCDRNSGRSHAQVNGKKREQTGPQLPLQLNEISRLFARNADALTFHLPSRIHIPLGSVNK